ncbi:MAG: amino acid ABC transporter permease [Clostridia bacterium]|nr:amino acid ABC transporter permease [Clostridia bacterium]
MKFFTDLWANFYKCFLQYDMWKMYLQGLRNTVIIAVGACLFGLIIGIIVTCIRVAPKNNIIMKFLDGVCKVYVTVIRGTPVVLQLFICYFVLLTGIRNVNFFGIKDTAGILVAIVTFGINSGAYMTEILRGGINAVDAGQMEAGRSLGLSWISTFLRIVLPQALKSAIPTMFNEFITLVKETSVAGYVGIVDLTKIQSYVTVQTMELFMPLLIIAAIYLILVLGLQQIQKRIERRLTRGDR